MGKNATFIAAGRAVSIFELQERTRALALSYASSGELFDDLIQEGMLALLCAARMYRGDNGAHLWTYARRRVRGAMSRIAAKRRGERDVFVSTENAEPVCEDSPELAAQTQETIDALEEETRSILRDSLEGETFDDIANARGTSRARAHRLYTHAAREIATGAANGA